MTYKKRDQSVSFIEQSIEKLKSLNLCMRLGCTTCGSYEFRSEILLSVISYWFINHDFSEVDLLKINEFKNRVKDKDFHKFLRDDNYETIKILKPIVINDLKKLKKVESDPILLILDDFMISHQEKYLLGTEVGKFLDKRAKLISARLERSILNKFENDKIREKRKIINEEKKIAHIERKKERDLKRKEYLMLLQNMSDEDKFRFLISEKFEMNIETFRPSELNIINPISIISSKFTRNEKIQFVNLIKIRRGKFRKSHWRTIVKSVLFELDHEDNGGKYKLLNFKKNLPEINWRHSRLREAHVRKLNGSVTWLKKLYPEQEFPYFDPADGGVEAEVLFLFEKPGPKATFDKGGSGFISRDNADETAKNTSIFMKEAGLDRKKTVIWNVIPGWNGQIDFNIEELRKGINHLKIILKDLKKIHTIVFVGKTAARAEYLFNKSNIRILKSAHPSPQVKAGHPDIWNEIPKIWGLSKYKIITNQ